MNFVSVLPSRSIDADSNGRQQDQELSIIDGIASWCESLSGQIPLIEGLRQVLGALDGAAICLTRVQENSSRIGTSMIVDTETSQKRGHRLERSFASIVLGPYCLKPKPGTPWFSSMLDGEVDPALRDFQRRRGLQELVVIPLEIKGKTVDFLEIHFEQRLDGNQFALLNLAAATFVRTWGRRATGLFSEYILSPLKTKRDKLSELPLLSVENPARLSRCEYRVCLMLSRGYSVQAIEEEFGISRTTSRTHLRNIYAKTGCSSLAELTFRLMDKTKPGISGFDAEARVV
ncbi:helix-turn-helix transcriptional regulator [Flavimaricola marinus]|uniref:helix-turn-helix transcriptional regulator n=1 Tax=Flavimaricola marinus TaxID=1819565 RepID=UPI001056B4AC|nr:helix-turn-helix transcriptional regulator [Flavimaricola marinus]